MRVRGLYWQQIAEIARDLDMFTANEREYGNFKAFKLKPRSARTYYSRKTQSGRRITALCFHGWRDFIRVCFTQGADRITSSLGRWGSIDEFDMDLPRIQGLNVGSMLYPLTMPELCTHEGPLPPLLRRAQEVSRKQTRISEAVA